MRRPGGPSSQREAHSFCLLCFLSLTDSNCTETPCKNTLFLSFFVVVGICGNVKCPTHRPGKTEGQNYPGSVIPDRAPERKGIPSEDGRRSHSEAAGPRGGDPGLVFLQANFKKRIALVPRAPPVRRAPAPVAAAAAQQLPVRVVHGQDLQLELSGAL